MKKLLIGLFVLSAVAYAEDSITLRAEIAGTTNYTVSGDGSGSSDKKLDGYGFMIEPVTEMTDKFHTGLGFGYVKNAKLKGELPSTRSALLYVHTKYRMNDKQDMTPYVKADLGYAFNSPRVSKKDYDTDNGLFYGVGVGLDVNWALSVDLMYRVIQGDIKEKSTGKKYDVDNKTISLGFSVNIK